MLESPPVEACLGLQPPARRSRYRRDGRDLATDLATDPVVRDPRDTVVIRCRPRTILSLSEQRNSTTHTFRIANEAMRYESSCNTPCNTIRAVGVGGNKVTIKRIRSPHFAALSALRTIDTTTGSPLAMASGLSEGVRSLRRPLALARAGRDVLVRGIAVGAWQHQRRERTPPAPSVAK